MIAHANHAISKAAGEAGEAGRLVSLLGIDFVAGGYGDAIKRVHHGGLIVFPAAPALAHVETDASYYAALRNSDVAIPDSGLMVLLARVLRGQRMTRLSGLAFIRRFLEEPELRTSGCLFLVDPDDDARERNHAYLRSKGIPIALTDHYVAPMYVRTDVEDPALLERIEARRPRYVLINLGGGTQEKLGSYLKRSLSYRPAMLCTGAAIAFLTGEQVRISPRMDRWRLGWLLRCLSDPARSIPKYRDALALVPLMARRGKRPDLSEPLA